MTAFRKEGGVVCPSQSALGARGSAEGKLLQTPLLEDFGGRRAPWHQGSALFQTHSGRQGQKQWLEAFGRGPEEKKNLLCSYCMGYFSAAALTRQWRRNREHGRKDHTHQGDHPRQNQQSPGCIIHIIHCHLCQTLRKGIKSLFRNTRGQ